MKSIAGNERLELIDALRGFALAGVLLMNLGAFTLIDDLDPQGRAALMTASFDRWAAKLLELLVNGKAITVFSLLFGIGFAMQIERARACGTGGIGLFTRRMLVLFGLGLLHAYLIWWGDILHIYALLGLLLLLFRHLSDRGLLLSGLLVALLLPAVMQPWMDAAQVGSPDLYEMRSRSLEAFMSPSYGVALRHNVDFLDWSRLGMWGVLPAVLGRFLLGYWAGRKRLLREPAMHKGTLQHVFLWSAAVGLVATAYTSFDHLLHVAFADPFSKAFLNVAINAGTLALGVAYITSFSLLFLLPAWRTRLRIFGPVGRMALTNYLLQSIVCVLVFYGFGLGVGPRFGYAGLLVAWATVFSGQILASHWWLGRYHFGPLEWVWRSLTYWQLQPMQKLDPRPPSDGTVLP